MKKVDDLVKLKKIGEAIGQLPDLKQFPEFETEIKKKSQELRGQHSSLSLFADETVIKGSEEDTTEENEGNTDVDDDNNEDNDEEILEENDDNYEDEYNA